VKRPQWITIIIAICLVAALYVFGIIIPPKKTASAKTELSSETMTSIDSILAQAKKILSLEQLNQLNGLEHSVKRGDVKDQQIKVYHELSSFWKDSAHISMLYLWYEGEAARLENSEKSLTFAAHLFLDSLLEQNVPQIKQWQAFQAKDLFERSLKLNPINDSSKVGLGAVYIYGGITMPMQGITMVKEVADRDSTNIYAQMTLGTASLMTNQTEKAIDHFKKVAGLQPGNIEAIFRVASIYEQLGNKSEAIKWYTRLLPLLKESEAKNIETRIAELKK
jgi:tetratricopeptide (TPR) repeat protein